MRLLGIDFGTKHIGLAVGDTEICIATPHHAFTYKTLAEAKTTLGKVIGKIQPEKVVFGLPLSFKGEETDLSARVRAFALEVAAQEGVAVEFENEMLSTDLARRYTAKKPSHASVAALILQSYLERLCQGGYNKGKDG
jgi:putative Holliday junction resolvase